MIARKYGVVYTPDRLADFAAELLCAEIEKSEFDSVNVLDPACGECALLDSVKKIKRNEYEYMQNADTHSPVPMQSMRAEV